MAHFKILVILPKDTGDVQEKVKELLSPYNSELKVEPYKEYLNQAIVKIEIQRLSTLSRENIDNLAAEYEVSSDDLESLAKMNLDWYEEGIVGVDEYGSYRMTTINPQAKWDWHNFIEAECRESEAPIKYPCLVGNLSEVIPYAIVTPDGQWHEISKQASVEVLKRIYLHSDAPISEEELNWDLKVQNILACYSDYLAVGLNCHI